MYVLNLNFYMIKLRKQFVNYKYSFIYKLYTVYYTHNLTLNKINLLEYFKKKFSNISTGLHYFDFNFNKYFFCSS